MSNLISNQIPPHWRGPVRVRVEIKEKKENAYIMFSHTIYITYHIPYVTGHNEQKGVHVVDHRLLCVLRNQFGNPM
jgi:hypothetical protein